MAEFVAKVGTPSGQVIERTYTANNEEELRQNFDEKEFLVFHIKKKAAAASLLSLTGFRKKKIGAKEFLVFNQELASLINAGLPIVSSLEILLERRKNPVFREALVDIRDQVKSGTSLSDAFASFGDLFPRLYAPALSSGERSGEVAGVLKRYVAYTKTMMSLRQKIVHALTYPMILVAVSMGLIGLLVTFVLPKFEGFFEDLGTQKPLLTRVVIGISSGVTNNGLIILPAVILAIFGIAFYKKTDAGAAMWDRIKMRLPLMGSITNKYSVSSFTRTLGTLVRGGIPLVTSLEISARAIANRVFSTAMLGVTQQVREGQPLWESIEKTGLMSDMAISMIRVGESTGSLEEMLSNISDFYDDEIEGELARIVSLMEPALLIMMGLIIATIIMAFYLPLITSLSTTNV